MSYSGLEHSLLAAGNALSAGAMGRDLRAYHPGRRMPGDRFSFLAGMELNHPPPIQRTARILYTAQLTGFDLHLSDEDRAYLAWVGKAGTLLEALADSWWGAINPDLRILFVDGDDAPPLVLLNTMFPGLRARRPAELHRAARALGLNDPELSALSRAAREAQHTPVYQTATQVAEQVRSNATGRRALQGARDRIMQELVVRPMTGISDETDRLREAVATAYAKADGWVRWAAQALRAYNELVTACFAFLLGYAEALEPQTPALIEDEHPATVEMEGREFSVHLTFTEPRSLATGATFAIHDEGPLDGLYIQTGSGFQYWGDAQILDRYGFRIRDLEGAF